MSELVFHMSRLVIFMLDLENNPKIVINRVDKYPNMETSLDFQMQSLLNNNYQNKY